MSFGKPLADFIRQTIGPLFGFGFHPAAVVSQASDGSVEVKPDSPVVPPQKGVPLVLGVPGIKVKVGPGTRVRLSFASGNPGASEVALWEGDGLLELELDASVKVVLKAPQVLLGGPAAAQAFVLGTTYRAAESTCNTALATQLAAAGAALNTAGVDPVLVAAASAAAGSLVTAGAALALAATALSTLEGGSAGYLSTTVKGTP